MTTELLYLTLATAFTALLWMPYILDRFATRGVSDTVGYPANPPAQSSCRRQSGVSLQHDPGGGT